MGGQSPGSRRTATPLLSLLLRLSLLSALPWLSWAVTDCEIQFETSLADRIIPVSAVLACTGDPVTFRVGLDVYSAVLPDTTGVASLTLSDEFGGIQLEDAEDVTFTSVSLKYYDYGPDLAALTLRRCRRCIIRNLIIEDVLMRGGTTSAILFEDADVIVDGAFLTRLGQMAEDSYTGAVTSTSGLAFLSTNSNVTLSNVVMTGWDMTYQVAAVVVDGGSLMAVNSSWADLGYLPEVLDFPPPRQGRAVVASNGASVAFQGCMIEGVAVQPLLDGGRAALIHASSGASVSIDTDSSIFVQSDDTGVVLLADGAGSLVLDGRSLYVGNSSVPGRPSLATSWRQPPVVVLNHGSAADVLSLANVAIDIQSSTAVQLAGGNLLRLSILDSTVDAVGITLSNLTSLPGPAVGVSGATSSFSCTDCTFATLQSSLDASISVDTALALDIAGAAVTLTRCSFHAISWTTEWESEAVRVAAAGSLLAVNTTFSAIGGGGTALRVRDGAAAELRGVNITDIDTSTLGPGSERRAAVVVDPGASLRASRCTWQRLNVGSSTSGAALTALQSAVLTLSSCTFSDIVSRSAPAVQVSGPAADGVAFTSCEWRNVAGIALKLNRAAGSVLLSNGAFTSCTGGPALSLDTCVGASTAVQLQGMTFSNNGNSGTATGGAILSVNCTVDVRSSVFNGNAANTGGAASAVASTMRFADSTFVANAAVLRGNQDGAGGALYADHGALSLDNCTLIANSASGSRPQGGAIATTSSTLVLRGGTLMHNSVRGTNDRGSGGGLYVEHSTSTVVGTTFFANAATYSGGAIHVAYSPLLLQDAVLLENSAAMGGSVFLFEADASLPPASLAAPPPPALALPSPPPPAASPPAPAADSAAPAPSLAPPPPAEAEAASGSRRLLADAGVDLQAAGSFYSVIANSSFTKNKCTANSSAGGALMAVRQNEFRWRLSVQGSTFVGNACPSGGAIATQMLDSITVTRSTFRANRATLSGGAISLQPSDTGTVSYALVQGNTFTKNRANRVGGALQAGYGWTMDVNLNDFTGNGNPDADLAGGAMYVEKCRNAPSAPPTAANINMRYNNFTENVARDGGAFYATMCNVSIWRDQYRSNTVTGGGGALYGANAEQTSLSTLQLDEAYLENNFARGSGGAVNVISQGLRLYDSTFVDNAANIAGGAVFASEASPVALKALNRTTTPYYTTEEQAFLRFEVYGVNFTGNRAESGGGAVYVDSSELLVHSSNFTSNVGGDGFPNDEWSDSGGALFGASCFGITNIYSSRFDGNRANGGPGGAILKTACSLALQACAFSDNLASTYGGAIAAANRRKADSTALNTPNLVLSSCNFVNNSALTNDGGAAFTRDINATVFTSTFAKNSAGGSGGAMAFLNNLGSAVRASVFEDNQATSYGGAAYFLTTPLVSVMDSQFRRNSAAQTGGALSVVQCNCTLASHTTFDGNSAGGQGGALHLQPKTTLPGDTNELADSGNCVGEFLQQVRLRMSPQGRGLLRTVERPVETYNATIVYDGAVLGYQGIGLFARGGVQLSVPNAHGPAQLFGYDVTVLPANQSTVTLAAGSALPYANWNEYLVQADTVGTHVTHTNSDTDIDVVSGVEMVLAAGSTVTALSSGMSMLPTGGSMVVQGSVWLLSNGTVVQPNPGAPVITTVPAAQGKITPAEGTATSISDWNRYILWSSGGSRTVLYDTFTGRTDLLDGGAQVALSNGSPLIRHDRGAVTLPASQTLSVQAGSWVLDNGTTLTPGGSRVAMSAVPANGSTIRVASGSTIAVNDWASVLFRLQANGMRLEHATRGSGEDLPAGTRVSLGGGSAIVSLRDGTMWLHGKTQLSVEGSSWMLSDADSTVLSPEGGNVAISLVLTPGSTVTGTDGGGAAFSVAVADWNRYTLWAGPADTLLYDAVLGTVTPVADGATVSLAKGGPVTFHADSALLPTSMEMRVSGASWALGNGTVLATGGSMVSLTAVAAFQSTVSLSNGTVLQVRDWYRYIVWAGRDGSYVYDTVSGSSYTLADGAAVSLSRLSVLIAQSSFTTLTPADTALTVQGNTLASDDAIATITPAADVQQVMVLPSATTTVTVGPTRTLPVDSTTPYILWIGRNGSFLYNTDLLAGYHLTDGSSTNLTAGSLLIVHDSSTTVLQSATNLTVDGRTWSLSNGASLSIGGDTVSLTAAPAAGSRLVFVRPWELTLTGNYRYGVWAGRGSTLLYDATLQASYTLADGSSFTLAPNSTITYRNMASEVLPPGITMAVRGASWLLGNGTTIFPGDGTGSTSQAVMSLYMPSYSPVEDEVDRVCAVDFATAQYQANPYSYDYAGVQAMLLGVPIADFSTTNISPRVAAAAYGYGPEADASGYNASLLVTGFPQATWDELGRPRGVQVSCTATTVPASTSYARGVNMLLLDVTAVNNQAKLRGGAITFDGGYGRVVLDGLQVYNNNVTEGNGGGLAIYQDGDERYMQLEVFVTSSNFANNQAAVGSGGGLYLGSELLHQQVMLLNSTLDSNMAAVGGGLSVIKHVSVALNASTVSNNVADSTGLGANSAVDFANQQNLGSGGGIMASLCNELQLTAGTRLSNNTATGRGGGLSVSACALLLVNTTQVEGNGAQSAGGVYVVNSLPVKGAYRPDNPVGASIAVVLKSDFVGNAADNTTDSDTELEGFGGAFMVNGHVSTLLADSYFEGNLASLQGGSIFIQSTCDLDATSWFLARNMSVPSAFPGVDSILGSTVQSLQWPRPKYCWGTVVYLPRFFKNEAARSGGALFASHPEALSLVCDSSSASNSSSGPTTSNTATSSDSAGPGSSGAGGPNGVEAAEGVSPMQIDYANFDEGYLAAGVLAAMKKASFQVLDNRIVQSCYRDEIERIYNQSVQLTGTQLSTLSISNNRAKGYGYLIAIIPSKLRILEVTWTGNTSNVASGDVQMVDDSLLSSMDEQLADEGGGGSVLSDLVSRPLFTASPGAVFDQDTNDFRQIVNYHITTYSNIPMDMPIVLLDALDQVASENTTLRQAQVRARYLNSTNGCKAELLGGIEGVARNGTAMMNAMRLRALKGENYSIEFRVEDSTFAGSVEPLVVNVTVPACSIGEVPRDNGYLCQKCDPRSFSLWLDLDPLVNCTYPGLSDITCLPCPDGAECPGGALVVPQQGYWHSAANSTAINPCQNQDACRGSDDDAQDALVACQSWWYTRPAGFDYQAFVDSVLADDSSSFSDAPGALPDGSYNASELCVLWGLPFDHPASYAFQQCAEGYGGNLCAVCMPVDGMLYAGNGDFECGQCFDRGLSIAIAVGGFVANVATVLVTIVLTFLADYTEDEELAIGDLLKVLIVHIQFFVIVTRLNIDWPRSVSGFTSTLSALTGAVVKVYTPSCLLDLDATPADMARINQMAAIASPLVCTVVVAVLWMIRYMLFNFRAQTSGQRMPKDMRTIEEYRQDRAQRLAAKRRQASQRHMEDMLEGVDLNGCMEEGEDEEGGRGGFLDLPDYLSGASVYTRGDAISPNPRKLQHTAAELSPNPTPTKRPESSNGRKQDQSDGAGAGAGKGAAEAGGPQTADTAAAAAADHIGVVIPPDSAAADHALGQGAEAEAVAHIVDMPAPPAAPLPPPPAPPPPAPLRPVASARSPPTSGSGGAAGALPSPTSPGTARPPRLPTIRSRRDLVDGAEGAGGDGGDGGESGKGGAAGSERSNSIGRSRGGPSRHSSRKQRQLNPSASQRTRGSSRGSGGGASDVGSGGATDGERTESRFSRLRNMLSMGSLLVKNFFTYDEEAAEEGEVRWASLANIDRTMTWWRQELLVVMIACFILYPAWAQATLQIFACYYLDEGVGSYPEFQLAQWGRGYWLLNMNQECYAGEHARVYVPLGLAGIAVVCIGIPFLTFFTMWSHRTALRTVHVAQTYGFLYRRYNYDKYYGWEAIMQLQTLLLVVVDVFGRVLAVYQQAVLLMLALMLIMWSNMYFQPLKHELLDRMSSLSLAVLSFTVALGLFFVPPADRKDPVTPVAAAAIGGIILALNIALVAYFCYVMVTHGRDAIVRGVTVARETLVGATSKVQLGLTTGLSGITTGLRVVGGSVSTGALKMRSVTTHGLSSIKDRVGETVRKRTTSNLP